MKLIDTPHESLPCIWMTAGLLSYRLCDRDYDCEHCPLDHALQGTVSPEVAETSRVRAGSHAADERTAELPDDRRYTATHTWVRPTTDDSEPAVRVGLDAFAAVLLGPPRRIRAVVEPGRSVKSGAPLCELELDVGVLTVGAPFEAELVGTNPRLEQDLALLQTDPYHAGWLAELRAPAGAEAPLELAADACRRTAHDVRRLRRQVALAMLTDESELGMTLPDGGELVTDLCALLGGRRWLELLREFVH